MPEKMIHGQIQYNSPETSIHSDFCARLSNLHEVIDPVRDPEYTYRDFFVASFAEWLDHIAASSPKNNVLGEHSTLFEIYLDENDHPQV